MNTTEGMKAWQRKGHGLALVVVGFCYGYSSLMLLPVMAKYLDHKYISSVFFLIGSLALLLAWAVAAEMCRYDKIGREFWSSLINSALTFCGTCIYIYASFWFVKTLNHTAFYSDFSIGSIILLASQAWKVGVIYFSYSEKTRPMVWKKTHFWTEMAILIGSLSYLVGFRLL